MARTLAAAPRRSTGAYSPPTPEAAAALRRTVAAALGPDPGSAAPMAKTAGYASCQDRDVVILVPSPGHALVALRRGAARPLVVGVAHPLHEPLTPAQGRLAFSRWRARALVVAGAHRCSGTLPSPCSGKTAVCGAEREAFRESDAGHSTSTLFQVTHEALLAFDPQLTVISLHGMADEGISLSEGTRRTVSSSSLLARAARALAGAMPTERITACQAGAGVPIARRRCGLTNVQGRLVNGSPAPCRLPAPLSTGRFLHIEQSFLVRRDPGRLVDALTAALP